MQDIFLTLSVIIVCVVAALVVALKYPTFRHNYWRHGWHDVLHYIKHGFGPVSSNEATLVQAFSSHDSSIRVAIISTSLAGFFTVAAATVAGMFAILSPDGSERKASAAELLAVQISTKDLVSNWKVSVHYVNELPSVRNSIIEVCPTELLPSELVVKVYELGFSSTLYGCANFDGRVSTCDDAVKVVQAATKCKVIGYE